MSLRHLWRGPVKTDWLQSVAQERAWGWNGSRVQEEIGVSSQRAIGKCGRQQVQCDVREGKEERQDRQTDRPWSKAHQAFYGQMNV